MHYRKFWRKHGFKNKLIASLVETNVFMALFFSSSLIILFFHRYTMAPLHIAVSQFYKLIGFQPSYTAARFTIMVVTWFVIIGLTFPFLKIVYDNMTKVLLPNLLDYIEDDDY